MKALKLILLGIIIHFTSACTNNVVHSEFIEIPQNEWNFDSVLNFTFEVKEPITQSCNTIVYILHEKTYPYQNYWFYVQKTLPDSTVINDTIECYLADQRGQWLGSGNRNIMQMPVLIEQNIQLNQKGTYNYQLRHAMRDDILKGIKSMGIKIEQTDK